MEETTTVEPTTITEAETTTTEQVTLDPEATGSDDDSVPPLVIAVFVAGAVLFLAVLALFCYMCCRK